MRHYRISVTPVNKPTKPDTKGANAVEFTNRGEATAIVNGEELATNQTVSYSGHEGEIDDTLYDIKFRNTGAQTQLLFVKIKRYV